ncbi:hypothetical protein BKA82DRAFT_920725 [Pisolithus tinctorius]|uniref:Uncharacterized protein n=1 Tax=Pisolithus tinctorius Marx 270 TaxID=870435 RepID=A0A0C3JHI0_PISTI|nr:hypothetical protein BKA82DRAFT_920725 [Pisolithus tinctorius]KIN97071.1 hypothetical protein M404DRAFT_920725 [Pisolithus tinctorius Marx 270]
MMDRRTATLYLSIVHHGVQTSRLGGTSFHQEGSEIWDFYARYADRILPMTFVETTFLTHGIILCGSNAHISFTALRSPHRCRCCSLWHVSYLYHDHLPG